MTLLSDDEIAARLEDSDWRREGNAIVRDWRFKDFGEAISFVNRVADVAEGANHHPDILLHGWNHVRLTLSTHAEGGITGADLKLADSFDRL
jgi:4a-hydroxytetrahydrobiopterin dehydratase